VELNKFRRRGNEKGFQLTSKELLFKYRMKSNNGLYSITKGARLIAVADLLNLLSRKWELRRNIFIGPETSD
jgi:hypothetical protein